MSFWFCFTLKSELCLWLWSCFQVNGQWKGLSAGGCGNYKDSYKHNPIYQINLERSGPLLIELRGSRSDKSLIMWSWLLSCFLSVSRRPLQTLTQTVSSDKYNIRRIPSVCAEVGSYSLWLCLQAVQCWVWDGDGVDGGGSRTYCLTEEEQWRLQVELSLSLAFTTIKERNNYIEFQYLKNWQ